VVVAVVINLAQVLLVLAVLEAERLEIIPRKLLVLLVKATPVALTLLPTLVIFVVVVVAVQAARVFHLLKLMITALGIMAATAAPVVLSMALGMAEAAEEA
jgi:hypothetical protein